MLYYNLQVSADVAKGAARLRVIRTGIGRPNRGACLLPFISRAFTSALALIHNDPHGMYSERGGNVFWALCSTWAEWRPNLVPISVRASTGRSPYLEAREH